METYGTGSDLQRAITAATAAVSGLSGGNLGSALSGAAAPYIANEIGKYITQDNALAGIMAHAVVNAALAKASGQNAAVGAAGAAVGEATGMLLAKEVYGKSDSSQLTDTEKQTISALSTLASGLAGGLTGGSSLSAAQGAQAGKTTVENNLLGGGTEEGQTKAAQAHGADVLSCSEDPGGAACQRGIADNKAYAGALASAGLIYLPGSMQVAAGIGGAANAGVQYIMNGTINPGDVLIASYVGAFTANTGLYSTVAINAAGGGLSNAIKGDSILEGATWGAFGSFAGYKLGNDIIEPYLGTQFAPLWKDTTWLGSLIPTTLPKVVGVSGGAMATETIGQGGSKVTDDIKKSMK